jgi:hypothetical protein
MWSSYFNRLDDDPGPQIPRRFAGLLMGLLMALSMGLIMSFVVTILNLGL